MGQVGEASALSLPEVRHASAIVPAVIIKLALVPLISAASAVLLGLDGHALASCVIEGAMPTMVLSLLIAEELKLDVPLAAFLIVVTTVLSFLTLQGNGLFCRVSFINGLPAPASKQA